MAQAYRHYSNGIQSTDSEAVELWRGRIGELQRAASFFRRVGFEEQALWSEFLVAYFTYFPVGEFQSASEMAQNIQVQTRETGMPQLELMATQLKGQAMIERNESDSPELAAAKLERAQQVFKQSAELAERRGNRFEHAWAINNRGIAYYYQGLFKEALNQYTQVLPMALDLQDAYLVNLALGNIALVNVSMGNHAAALTALLEIKQELSHSGLPAERAHNLADIGRLYSKLFLFPKAIDALTEAMSISRELGSKEGTGRIGLSLAMAYYDMGQRQRAQDMLLSAIDDMKGANYGRGLQEAYRLQADMNRFNGEYDQAGFYRELQRQYLRSDTERANFLFSQGLDALANGELARAGEFFIESYVTAIESENAGLQIRALLQRCALVPVYVPEFIGCDTTRLERMLNDWLPYVVPRFEFDARFSWAQLLTKQGKERAALDELEDLVADIRLYRSSLTGVLGAWYWESREKVFSTYMALVLNRVQSQHHKMASLVALDQFRNLENSGHRTKQSLIESDFNADEIRDLIASMSGSRDDNARQEFGRTIDQLLLEAGNTENFDTIEDADLLSVFTSLPSDVAFLTYYFSDSGAWAWIAGRQGFHQVRLGDAQPILELLVKVREKLRVVGRGSLEQDLDALGTLLLQPLGASLPTTIYLGSAGALAGFPFEAIKYNGRHLAQDHVVINLLSMSGLYDLAKPKEMAQQWGPVFLAGAPTGFRGDFNEISGAASEIESIANLFEQRQVHKFVGENVHRESFSRPVFSKAGLIHIASHGNINLDYPELSRLTLSKQPGGEGFDYLTPLDIRHHSIQASLVVLSACETTGLNDFSFDSNLGFVSAFLQAGAGSVVASLWPVPDRFTREFMLDFYSALIRGAEIPDALVLAKRKHLITNKAKDKQERGTPDWAAFQIYID